MRRFIAVLGLLLTVLLGCGAPPPAGQRVPKLRVLGVENFYADVARQVGGQHVLVDTILSDPSLDPHVYESSVEDAKLVAQADVVIENGAGYDAFVDKLLAASPRPGSAVRSCSCIRRSISTLSPSTAVHRRLARCGPSADPGTGPTKSMSPSRRSPRSRSNSASEAVSSFPEGGGRSISAISRPCDPTISPSRWRPPVTGESTPQVEG